jgi:hypothetical protein
LFGHFVDAGLSARFIVLAPRRAAYTNSSDSLVPEFNRQAAQGRYHAACGAEPPRDWVIEQPL